MLTELQLNRILVTKEYKKIERIKLYDDVCLILKEGEAHPLFNKALRCERHLNKMSKV